VDLQRRIAAARIWWTELTSNFMIHHVRGECFVYGKHGRSIVAAANRQVCREFSTLDGVGV
jgi:hypothetical protein